MKLKEYMVSSGSGKNMKGWTKYFRHKHSIKISKNKLDSSVTKSHQLSLKRFSTVSIELNTKY